MSLQFEWDSRKAKINTKKHGVSFDEASTVFANPLSRIFYDKEHSIDEEREIIIGHSTIHRLIIVCFTERSRDLVRIISARKATKKEGKAYEKNTNF